MAAISIEALSFAWAQQSPVIDIPSCSIAAGEMVFLQGPSGSGKSTLLNLMTGMLVPQQGEIRIGDTRLNRLNSVARDRFRADHIGFIFQSLNLLPYLSIEANVQLACRVSKQRRQRAIARFGSVQSACISLLSSLGLAELVDEKRPVSQLSVGQQQRVAIARALIGAPELIIADEPTSALDTASAQRFVALLQAEVKAADATLILVSHDERLAPQFDRVIQLADINQASQTVGGVYVD